MAWSAPVGNLKGPKGPPRSADPGGPLCITRLNKNLAVPSRDVRPVSFWNPTAEVDTHSMYHYNTGGDTWWTIPQSGRYAVTVVTFWDNFGPFDPQRPPWVSTSLLLNSQPDGTDWHSPALYAIAERTARHDMNYPGMYLRYSFTCEDRVFAVGDTLHVNFYSLYGGTLLASRGLAYTEIKISYLRPN